MRVLFWGTPEFAIPAFRAIGGEGHDIVGVITQPDRPAGRGRRLTPSPVKVLALEEGYPVLTPDRPQGEEFLAQIRALAPDVSVVVAYGHILVREVLDVPPQGSINVHASLLPELRGAAPVNWAIVRGHETTGASVMRMVEAMDAGPVLLQAEEVIGARDSASDLSERLSELGAAVLVEALTALEIGGLDETPQDASAATFAPKVSRAVARVEWNREAKDIANLVRGMDSVPGAWSELNGDPVKLFSPTPHQGERRSDFGTLLTADATDGLSVAAGVGSVTFGEVQPPGKRRMPAEEWIRGRGAAVGQRFQ